jgi:hypothetical protein
METTLFGIFLILHGLIHLLYVALSRKLFELEPPLTGWPEKSWLFARSLGVTGTRNLASVLYGIAVMLFVVSGIGRLLAVTNWPSFVILAAVFSSVTIIAFGDGVLKRLPDKGFVGILINAAILVILLLPPAPV